MVYQIRSIFISQGKQKEAWAWAIKVAKYVNDSYPDAKVEVVQHISGPLNQVLWSVSYASMAQAEESMAKLDADAGYGKLLEETEGMFVGSTLEDNWFRTVG